MFLKLGWVTIGSCETSHHLLSWVSHGKLIRKDFAHDGGLSCWKEDKMSQLTLERQRYSLSCLCCHSCKNINVFWVLIILIKFVLLFVWPFPERNTDFLYCFISAQKPKAWQGPSLNKARAYVLWFPKHAVKYPTYFTNAVTESLLFFRLIP